jgi:hypothetical protein
MSTVPRKMADGLDGRAAGPGSEPVGRTDRDGGATLIVAGVGRLAKRRRADDVAEQHCHHLPVRADRHEPRLNHRRQPG